jgi:hypothetical protein
MKVNHIRIPKTVRFPYLLFLLVALVIADGLITQSVVDAGLGREVNPFLQNLISNGNLIGFKIVGALVCIFILWDIYRRHSNLAVISTVVLIAAYTGIVYWNTFSFVVAGF